MSHPPKVARSYAAPSSPETLVQKAMKTEKQVAPSAWLWIGALMMGAALVAGLIAGYWYFFHAAK